MAFKHDLSLEIPDTNNTKVFRISDTSLYAEQLDTDCGKLHILPPGFTQGATLDVLPGFNLVLNACSLGLQRKNCGDVNNRIPDGIYVVRYSVAPNDKVYVEYNYLRVTQTLNKYYNELCKLELAACEPDNEIKAQLKELQLIKGYIDAAKAKVEYCNEPENGMELLLYAQKMLQKYIDECC